MTNEGPRPTDDRPAADGRLGHCHREADWPQAKKPRFAGAGGKKSPVQRLQQALRSWPPDLSEAPEMGGARRSVVSGVGRAAFEAFCIVAVEPTDRPFAKVRHE